MWAVSLSRTLGESYSLKTGQGAHSVADETGSTLAACRAHDWYPNTVSHLDRRHSGPNELNDSDSFVSEAYVALALVNIRRTEPANLAFSERPCREEIERVPGVCDPDHDVGGFDDLFRTLLDDFSARGAVEGRIFDRKSSRSSRRYLAWHG